MEARDIQSLLTADPFAPFRVQTTRTGSYAVTSPADVLLTRTAIYLAEGRDADGIAKDARMIPIVQVTSIVTV